MREMAKLLGPALLVVVLSIGCKDATNKASDDKSSSSKDSKSDKKKAEGSPKGPKDLDLDALVDDVDCKDGDDRKGCGCLEAFRGAGGFGDLPDDGGATWVGYTYGLGGPGDGKKGYFFLQVQSGRADDDAIEKAGLKDEAVVDAKGSARTLVPENDDEESDAKAVVKALQGGGKPPKGSEAAKFVKTSKPEGGYRAMAKTKGTSLVVAEGLGKAFLRVDGDRVLLVERADSGGLVGDDKKLGKAKTYCSELWKLP